MMASGQTETEIKLRVTDIVAVQRELRELGFAQKTPRTFESNEVYDTPGNALRSEGSVLRVRVYGEEFVLTFKGAGQIGRHKVREEIETKVESVEPMRQILERLGFRIAFRYEKYRTEYVDGHGAAVIDETPIGDYVELEGDGEWIDRVAQGLGYSERDYITKSYGRLYNEYCASRTRTPGDMVFGNEP